MGIDPIADVFLHVYAEKIPDFSNSVTKLKYDCVEYGCTESIWYENGLANVLNNIDHKRKEVNNRLGYTTTADVLAGISFNERPRCGLEARYQVDSRLQQFANDLSCENSLSGFEVADIPPHEHLSDNLYQIQDPYHEATEQDRRQRWSEGGNVWAAPDVKYNNPFDPRLQFDGLLNTDKKRKLAEDIPMWYKRDVFNCALSDPCPVRFADDYLNKYRKLVHDLSGDEQTSSPNGSSRTNRNGVPPRENTHKRFPVFVDHTDEDKHLWNDIRSTRRLWDQEDVHDQRVETNDGIFDQSTLNTTSSETVNTIPVINTLKTRIRGNRGRTQQTARTRHLRDVTETLTNKPIDAESTNHRRQDIYDWLAGIQTGAGSAAPCQPEVNIGDGPLPGENIVCAGDLLDKYPVVSRNEGQTQDRTADQCNDTGVKTNTDFGASEDALPGEQSMLRRHTVPVESPGDNGTAQQRYSVHQHQHVHRSGAQFLQATHGHHHHHQLCSASELRYEVRARENCQQAPRTEISEQLKVTHCNQPEVSTNVADSKQEDRSAILSTPSSIDCAAQQSFVAGHSGQYLASPELSQQHCCERSSTTNTNEQYDSATTTTTTSQTTFKSRGQRFTTAGSYSQHGVNTQHSHQSPIRQHTPVDSQQNNATSPLTGSQALSTKQSTGIDVNRQFDINDPCIRPMSAYHLLKLRSGANRTTRYSNREPQRDLSKQPYSQSSTNGCTQWACDEVEQRLDGTPSLTQSQYQANQSSETGKHIQQPSAVESGPQHLSIQRQSTESSQTSRSFHPPSDDVHSQSPNTTPAPSVRLLSGSGQVLRGTTFSHNKPVSAGLFYQQPPISFEQRCPQGLKQPISAEAHSCKQPYGGNSYTQHASARDPTKCFFHNRQNIDQRQHQHNHIQQQHSHDHQLSQQQKQPLQETQTFPFYTSMFWSHHQRQHSKERQQKQEKNGQHREYEEHYADVQQTPLGDTDPVEHRNSDQQGQQSQQPDLFYYSESLQSIPQKPAHQHQQRQVTGQRNAKTSGTATQYHTQHRHHHYPLPPPETQGAGIEQYRHPLPPPPPPFLSASGFPGPIYMSEGQESGSLKFDDEVWYINGVPHQHARPFIPQPMITEMNVDSSFPVAPFDIMGNPHFVPPPFMIDPASAYKNVPYVQPGSTQNTSYHLGVPVQLSDTRVLNYNVNANSNDIDEPDETESHIILESARPNSADSTNFIETVNLSKSTPSSSISDLQQVPSVSSIEESDEKSSDTSAPPSLTSHFRRYMNGLGNLNDAIDTFGRFLKLTRSAISSTESESDSMSEAEFDDINNHLSDERLNNKTDGATPGSRCGKALMKGRKIRVIRHKPQNWTKHNVKLQANKPSRSIRSSLITIL